MRRYCKRPLAVVLMILASLISSNIQAQTKIEKVHAISKKAIKGFLYEASLNEKGNIELAFGIKSGKDQVVFEVYEFDKQLNLLGSKEVSNWKPRYAERPEKNYSYIYATVGGGTSFNILSTKLNLYSRTVKKTWDASRQRYRTKVVKQEEIKPKNDENRTYNGNASFPLSDGSLMILASSTKTGKDDKNMEYSLLKIGKDLNLTDHPINFDRRHILAYALAMAPAAEDDDDEVVASDDDMLFVFAPVVGNLKEYTIIQFDYTGKQKHRFTVNTPLPVMAVTAHTVNKDGTLYLCALSADDKKVGYYDIIGEYAPIVNPSYTKYGTANYRMEKYDRKMDGAEFKEFTILKIKDGKLEWINSTPIADFKNKAVAPPGQKGSYSYTGRRFDVNSFYVTPDEGFIITGQVKKYLFKQEPLNIQYKDLVCLRIDSKGKVVAQYSYKPSCISDSKSAIFGITQELSLSKDGRYLYWTAFEVKAVKGYASFFDAYNGAATIYANYYPAVGRIDLQTNTLSNFDIMGAKKYLLNKRNAYIDLDSERSRVYIGEDKKGGIMLAKYTFE